MQGHFFYFWIVKLSFFSDTIENSIDHAAGNVEEATEHLVTASRYQNKYRRKILFLAMIGVIVIAIIVVILVVELKKK